MADMTAEKCVHNFSKKRETGSPLGRRRPYRSIILKHI